MPATYINPLTDFGFKPKDRQRYEDSLKYLRDLKNSEETARLEGHLAGLQEGLEKGLEQGLQEGLEKGKLAEKLGIARNLLDVLDDETIALKTGLTPGQVQALRQ